MPDDVEAVVVAAVAVAAAVAAGAGDVAVVVQRFVAPTNACFVVVPPAWMCNDVEAFDDDVVNLTLNLRYSEDFLITLGYELSSRGYRTVIHRYGVPLAKHLDADEVAFDRAGCRLLGQTPS